MFNIYYAHIYSINNSTPILLQELPLKAISLDSAWDEAIKHTFDDTDQMYPKMLMVLEDENPF